MANVKRRWQYHKFVRFVTSTSPSPPHRRCLPARRAAQLSRSPAGRAHRRRLPSRRGNAPYLVPLLLLTFQTLTALLGITTN